MQANHLIEPISCLLENTNTPFSEYELISLLQQQGWLERIDSQDSLSLYSVHFLVYNALFQLHERYKANHQHLLISALSIELLTVEADSYSAADTIALAGSDQSDMPELKSYYLDWNNLEQATKESVENLLNSFWDRFIEEDDFHKALGILGLSEHTKSITPHKIRQTYRKLAMELHPDRGGDVVQFQQINWAFSVLRRAL